MRLELHLRQPVRQQLPRAHLWGELLRCRFRRHVLHERFEHVPSGQRRRGHDTTARLLTEAPPARRPLQKIFTRAPSDSDTRKTRGCDDRARPPPHAMRRIREWTNRMSERENQARGIRDHRRLWRQSHAALAVAAAGAAKERTGAASGSTADSREERAGAGVGDPCPGARLLLATAFIGGGAADAAGRIASALA